MDFISPGDRPRFGSITSGVLEGGPCLRQHLDNGIVPCCGAVPRVPRDSAVVILVIVFHQLLPEIRVTSYAVITAWLERQRTR